LRRKLKARLTRLKFVEGETKTVIEMEIISVEGQCVDSNGENAADDAGPTDATNAPESTAATKTNDK